jgi:hypothetical protein
MSRTQGAPQAANPHEPGIHHLETDQEACENLTSTPASRHPPLNAGDVRPFSNASSGNNCLLRHVPYPIGPSRGKRSGRGGLRLMSVVECTCCERFSRGPRQPASTTSLKPFVQCARASSIQSSPLRDTEADRKAWVIPRPVDTRHEEITSAGSIQPRSMRGS